MLLSKCPVCDDKLRFIKEQKELLSILSTTSKITILVPLLI